MKPGRRAHLQRKRRVVRPLCQRTHERLDGASGSEPGRCGTVLGSRPLGHRQRTHLPGQAVAVRRSRPAGGCWRRQERGSPPTRAACTARGCQSRPRARRSRSTIRPTPCRRAYRAPGAPPGNRRPGWSWLHKRLPAKESGAKIYLFIYKRKKKKAHPKLGLGRGQTRPHFCRIFPRGTSKERQKRRKKKTRCREAGKAKKLGLHKLFRQTKRKTEGVWCSILETREFP